jgi:hypothetical protein
MQIARRRAAAAARGVKIVAVSEITRIIYQGRLAAVVIAEEAILTDPLPEPDECTVKAMCLYALEIAAGQTPGPYTDDKALEYAHRAQRQGAA